MTTSLKCGYHAELLPHLMRFVSDLPRGARVLDAGCGNGFFSGELLKLGHHVTGIDLSPTAIETCRREHPQGDYHMLRVGDAAMPSVVGSSFDAVIAMEVIEHLASTKPFLDNCRKVLSQQGILIISTPYHGYWKNLALALSGRFGSHLQPQIDGGHIKFWSRRALESMLSSNGFRPVAFEGCGRWPYLWKSMLIKAVRDA